MIASLAVRGNYACKPLGLRYAAVLRLGERTAWSSGMRVNDRASRRQIFVQLAVPRREMTVQRDEKTGPRRSMIVPPGKMIVQRGETIVHLGKAIVQRVETTAPRHHVYRLLRTVDRDAWLGEATTRFDDPIACVPDPIAR